MALGNGLIALLRFQDSTWKYYIYLFPANLGQGMVYPGILFTILATFDHSGKGVAIDHSDDKVFDDVPDHAVSASTVYLIRSLGTVWGVAISSAIVQNILAVRLPTALDGVPHKWEVSKLRSSS